MSGTPAKHERPASHTQAIRKPCGSLSLAEEVHFKGGKVLDGNFDTYELPRFSWVPKIETVLIDAKESPPEGGGEPAIIVMGAVVANAIYDKTGARLFQLPMTPERVLAAIQKA